MLDGILRFAVAILNYAIAFIAIVAFVFPLVIEKTTLDYTAALASFYGCILSVFGLAASLYAAFGINSVKVRLKSKVRLPDLLEKLTNSASRYTLIGSTTNEAAEIADIFSSLQSTIDAMLPNLKDNALIECRATKQLAVNLKKRRARIDGTQIRALDGFWEFYESLQVLIKAVDEQMQEMRLD